MPRIPRDKSRESQNRDSTRRSASANRMPVDVYTSQLHVPDFVIPDGMTYSWVATAVLGQPHPTGNWEKKYRKGWRPVPRSRHPEHFPPVPQISGQGNMSSEWIEQGGLVLCERPTKDVKLERKMIDNRAIQALKSVDWARDKDENPQLWSQTPKVNDSGDVSFMRTVEQPSEVKE